MKKHIAMWVMSAFIAVSLSYLLRAQTFGVQPSGVTLAQCTAAQPPAVNTLWFCNVANDAANPAGMYVSANGAAYFQVAKSGGGGGVTTFNNRSGNVLPAQGDYSYIQLANPPTKISCSTSSQSNSGFSASGCTFTP
jgi:hypothetical protein